MKILNKLVLLLLACCLFCISESVYSNNLNGLQPHKQRSHGINSKMDAEENCICYKKKPQAISVAEQLDEGNGLKRLVVYFYIDPHTNEINMYVPDANKQTLMPDFSLEKGDDMKNINNFTNGDILDHPNAVKIKTIKNVDEVTRLPKVNHNNNTFNDSKYFGAPNQAKRVMTAKDTLKLDDDVFDDPVLSDKNVQNNKITNNDDNNELHDEVSFDKWFNNQIQSVKIDTMNSNEMNTKLLKKLIENTLNENGMMVSEGKLKDKEGKLQDMAKLQLRPILIGDSVRYDNLLENQEKFSLPLDFPYLKSILVTLKDPSKILSIIPLGKMYLPKDTLISQSGSSKIKITDKSSKVQIPKKITRKENNVEPIACTGDHCQLQHGDQTHKDRDEHKDQRNEIKSNQYSDSKKLSIIANSLLNSERENKDKEIKNELLDTNRRFLQTKKRTKYYKNDISNELNQILKTKKLNIPILGRFNNNLHVNVNKKRINTKPHSEISEEDVYVDDLEEPGPDDEYPGFRIMGGHPALASGVPISVRGRSGWN